MASTIVRGPEKAEILFLFFSMYERKQENTLSTKEAIRKKRKEERKHAFDQESDQEKKEKKTFFFFLIVFLVCFLVEGVFSFLFFLLSCFR